MGHTINPSTHETEAGRSKASLVYRVSSMTARATQRKKKKKEREKEKEKENEKEKKTG